MLRKTDARKRVEEELEQRGMLLVEGSNDFPSVAGLQADNPGMVGGFPGIRHRLTPWPKAWPKNAMWCG